jgi:protein TonB
MVSEPVSTIVANALLDPPPDEDVDEPDEPPRLPALVLAPPPVPDPPPPAEPPALDDEPLPLVAAPEPPEDTGSPGDRLASETIVPLTGAYRLVLASACWALWRVASALYTDA